MNQHSTNMIILVYRKNLCKQTGTFVTRDGMATYFCFGIQQMLNQIHVLKKLYSSEVLIEETW